MPSHPRSGLCAAVVALALPAVLPVLAETDRPRLVRDINTTWRSGHSVPHAFHQVGDETFFFAVWGPQTPWSGERVLWKTDGSRAGTSLVTVGEGASLWESENAVEFRNRLFYGSTPGLWMSSGTARGTTLIKEVNFPEELIVLGRAVYFRANDPQHGEELWKSDGSASGTELVADIRAGPAGSEPEQFVVLDGLLYFVADGALWKSDGTTAGTKLVHSQGANWNPWRLTAAAGQLFFTARTAVGAELWAYDPAREWTRLVLDIHPGPESSLPYDFTEVHGTVFFSAEGAARGRELWKSDGTPSGTVLVTEGPGSANPLSLTAFGDTLVYRASDPVHGTELWRSDGTSEGTRMVADIRPGPSGSGPHDLRRLGDRVLFAATDGTTGEALWATDGDSASLLRDIMPWEMTVSNDLLFFSGEGEPWVSDGTIGGTFMLKDLDAQTGAAIDDYSRAVEFEGDLFFRARDGLHGGELWKTDGTEQGTRLVRDVLPGPEPAEGEGVRPLAAVGDRLIFMADDGIHGEEPWATDGTTGGTMLLKDIDPGPASTVIPFAGFAVFDGALFFGASDPSHGSELWRSDGTPVGTQRVADIVPGPDGSYPGEFAALEDVLLFEAWDPEHGSELWASDGTPGGTRLLADIRSGPNGCWMDELTVVDNRVYFSARTDRHGKELWTSDGTPDGTWQVMDIYPGAQGSNPELLTAAGDKLYFFARSPQYRTQLWVYDRATHGPTRVTDFVPPCGSWQPLSMIASGDSVFFPFQGDSCEDLLGTSDGTEAGTISLNLPLTGVFPTMLAAEGVVYVGAEHPLFGDEIWKTDGTPQGTTLAYDVAPGPRPSYPSLWGAFGGELYFAADNWLHGIELWAATINRRPVAVCRNVNVHAGPDGFADAEVDGGSYDPDGGIVGMRQQPHGPYGVGVTAVTLTVYDEDRAADSCTAHVTVSSTDPSRRAASFGR